MRTKNKRRIKRWSLMVTVNLVLEMEREFIGEIARAMACLIVVSSKG